MKILFYGLNYEPELIGIGKYSGEMALWLTQQGNEVRVITSPPFYPAWKVWPNFSKWFFSQSKVNGLTIWRCPLFVPLKPRTLLRILHLFSFALSSLPILMAQVFWRPNIVILVAPTLFCAPGALLLAGITGAKSILHIQDFEVDAMFALDLTSKISNIGIQKKIILSFESLILRCFNLVSTISSGMMQTAIDKGVDINKLILLPNWSEINRFKNIGSSRNLLSELGVPTDKKIILYSGNFGEKQGLENVILAAQQLQDRGDLVFLLVGEGSSESRLMAMSRELNLTNVIFRPLQSFDDFPCLLASADVHLVIQKRVIANAVLPSKLTNILSIGGNAVITADISTALGRLTLDNPGIAILIEPESVDALISGIQEALLMPRFNKFAQAYANKFLDKDMILMKFIEEISI